MSASNPHLQIGLRFCEVCGMFVGNLSQRDWDRGGHFCRECEEVYARPLMLRRTCFAAHAPVVPGSVK
jgi:hypothetical protein